MTKPNNRNAYWNQWIKAKRQHLRSLRGNICLFCGTKGRLHFAHIQPTNLSGAGRGRRKRILDISKHPDKYVLLCKSCHQRFDCGEIPPERFGWKTA